MEIVSRWLSELKSRGIDWYRYNIFFCKAAPFVSGLVFSHSLVKSAAVAVLMDYLTDTVIENHLPIAAATVNFMEGFTAIMVIVIAHLSDAAYPRRLIMIVLTNAGYVIGLLLLWLSALSSQTTKIVLLFVSGVLLVALGQAGKEPPLKAFLADQLCEQEQNSSVDEEQVEARTNVWWRVASFLGTAMAIFVQKASWIDTFKISALVMGGSLLFFRDGLESFDSYCRKGSTESPLTSVFIVFKTAIRRRHVEYPSEAAKFFENDPDQLQLLPHIPFFRWLDKAAIIEPSLPSREEQEKLGKPCTVTQVKEVKSLLNMIPVWLTFLMYSLVEATGSTFFIEQSSNLNAHIGNHFEVPIVSFIIFKSFTSSIISYLCELLIRKLCNTEEKRRLATRLRIVGGMGCSMLSCIAAWVAEDHRMTLIGYLPDFPDPPIAMSIFCLVPQFFLWGLMVGLAGDGLNSFFYDQVAQSMARYGPPFNECVLGIGKFLIALCVLSFRIWFGDTIDQSHLAEYYKMLAFLCLLNVLFCWFVLTFYAGKKAQGGGEEESVVDLEAANSDESGTVPRAGAQGGEAELETNLKGDDTFSGAEAQGGEEESETILKDNVESYPRSASWSRVRSRIPFLIRGNPEKVQQGFIE